MGKWILVSSHRRSGTHFLIDSIRTNVKNAIFPAHKHLPVDFNIGSLLREKEHIYKIFSDALYSNNTIIIKSHLLPEEMKICKPKNKYEKLVADIFKYSYKVYVYRDGMDVLVSLYRFLEYKGSFKEFLCSKNDHFVPTRNACFIDENRVRYWSYHLSSWFKEPNVLQVRFEDLKTNFECTIANLIDFLKETLPTVIVKPKIPQNIFLHKLIRRLHKIGLVKYVANSSVRPNAGNIGDSKNYFDSEDELFFKVNCLGNSND
ncbi:MAG: sulfotransferase domain-containing protein [Candidatus Jettenia sp.]|nr:MAG: sulfotransferase domain-containing protein [Candidatus Jettenia sp.]